MSEIPMVVLNITTPDGELLGRIELTADDLAHPAMIGNLVLGELPGISPAEFVRRFGGGVS